MGNQAALTVEPVLGVGPVTFSFSNEARQGLADILCLPIADLCHFAVSLQINLRILRFIKTTFLGP